MTTPAGRRDTGQDVDDDVTGPTAAGLSMEEALADLGVRRGLLTEAERTQLDELGYVIFESLLPPDAVDSIRARLDALLDEEGDRAGVEVHQELGTGRLSDLPNKGVEFEVCFAHPRVVAAVWHVHGYRPFRLSSLNARAAEPGHGAQGLHADALPPAAPGMYESCQTMWMIDGFTADNGATRIVPRSQARADAPADTMSNTADAHPEEILLCGPAGSVAVFPSNMWHGGTHNATATPRRAVHGLFSLRDAGQQLDQRAYIRPETYDRLRPGARWVLDVEGTRTGWAAGLSYHEWAERAGVEPAWSKQDLYPKAEGISP